MNVRLFESPVGLLTLRATAAGIFAIDWPGQKPTAGGTNPETAQGASILDQAVEELTAYFAGGLEAFSVPTNPAGTAFQRSVWRALSQIRFGETQTYGDLARSLGKPNASRAVGAATGKNPIPIIIPCHRLVGSQGALTGFAGGLDAKRQLLRLEGHHY